MHKYSDHCSLFIKVHVLKPKNISGECPQRFEDVCLNYEKCKDIIQRNWSSDGSGTLPNLVRKVDSCREALCRWKVDGIEDIQRDILKLQK